MTRLSDGVADALGVQLVYVNQIVEDAVQITQVGLADTLGYSLVYLNDVVKRFDNLWIHQRIDILLCTVDDNCPFGVHILQKHLNKLGLALLGS